MTQTEFLARLGAVYQRFNWRYVGNQIIGSLKNRRSKYSNRTFNPVTALAYQTGLGYFPATLNGTYKAGDKLNLRPSVTDAILSVENRGHAQVIRGKLLEELTIG